MLPREADRGEQLVEELPGGADEGDALLVLGLARTLADEEHLGRLAADAEDRLAAGFAQRTGCARFHGGARGRPVGGVCHKMISFYDFTFSIGRE